MNYRIIPLVLLKYASEHGVMTYLMHYGQMIIRPYILWVIDGGPKKILVDTAIEREDYMNYHPDFETLSMDALISFEEALASVHLSPEEIDIVIQTHLHFDHCYNTRKCRKAKVVVQKEELQIAQAPASPFKNLYRQDLLDGLNYEVVQGDCRLLDGIELIHVPGHSLGCQGVSVQTEKGEAVISGFCSIRENFYPEKTNPFIGHPVILPGILMDSVKAYESILKIKERADLILPLHEPDILKMKTIP
jgi:glyoxylase-like metal-dependent hydrolase (beta-lactamase superfamily II)